jgi:hypothetical protein
MELLKNINVKLITPLFTIILLALPVSVHADWSNPGMQPMLAPHAAPPVRVEPQHRQELPEHHQAPAQPVVHHTPVANHTQPARHDQPVRHDAIKPTYFRHDADYYGHVAVIFPYSDVDTSSFNVPDGFETVVVDGQTYFYSEGVFYQQMAGQLVAVAPVPGAVVDSIPEDYQIVMADGVHYLFTGGVYYQRVDQGFEVVEPPVSDQG